MSDSLRLSSQLHSKSQAQAAGSATGQAFFAEPSLDRFAPFQQLARESLDALLLAEPRSRLLFEGQALFDRPALERELSKLLPAPTPLPAAIARHAQRVSLWGFSDGSLLWIARLMDDSLHRAIASARLDLSARSHGFPPELALARLDRDQRLELPLPGLDALHDFWSDHFLSDLSDWLPGFHLSGLDGKGVSPRQLLSLPLADQERGRLDLSALLASPPQPTASDPV